MVKHNIFFEAIMLGKTQHKRIFIGRIFGKIALHNFIKDDSPVKRNMPTVNGFGVTEDTADTPPDTARWAALVAEYGNTTQPLFLHPFFGQITNEQGGRLVYKHIDHHLRQFGC